MAEEHRTPSTTLVTEMIQAHADLLAQHGISGGLASARPAAGTVGRFYFATDTKAWSRDNGTTWDENTPGLSEAYIQGLIDTSIAVLKDYVDSMVQGLDWQTSVIDELDTPPGTPNEGDRYLVIATATGDWVEHEGDIAEWNGASWDFTTPNKGFAVYVEDIGKQKNYNGTAWVAFGSTVDHSVLTGVTPDQHHTKFIQTDHDALPNPHHSNADDHPAPTYDSGTKEIVFQI